MPRWTSQPFRTLCTRFLLFFLLAASPALAQVRFVPDSLPDPLTEVLTRGRTLEQQKLWGEALTHYEEALRQHPGAQSLEERLDLSKIHYDLGRRYNDPGFLRSVKATDPGTGLELYSEVLLKIDAHHVSVPAWHHVVGRGTMCLDVALSDPKFQRQNLPGIRDDQLQSFRGELYTAVGSRSIRTRHDARNAVAAVAQLAGQRIGLAPSAVTFEYICGATGGLDPYSAFLTGDQLRDVYSQIEGNFVGLGIELKAEGGSLLLVNVISQSPAERAGIKAGDRIIAVAGRATAEMSTEEAASMLQGEEDSSVEVTVVSPGETPRRLQVRREHVEVPSIENVSLIDETIGVGYFKLSSFQKTTLRDLDMAMWRLHRLGMRSLVLDLRGNPGGLLTASVEIADKFLERGTIVSTRGRNSQEDYNYQAHQPGTWRVPLVVLIDGDSASASEIFAGAIRDNGRGTVIGERSYGKGSVQGIFPLSFAGAGVRITTAKFYSPAGRPISKVGVQPDIVVRHAAKATDGVFPIQHENDPVLEAAIRHARQQLAAR